MKHHWASQQDALLRLRYPGEPTATLAAELGLGTRQVYAHAHFLGLRKNAAYLASIFSGRIAHGLQNPAMISNRFQPGHISWNKGTHFAAGGRSAQTRFQPGNKPQTTLPVGSYRINKDGHLQRKIGETPGNNSRRWRGVAELVWMAAHGPLPPKHIVVFRPGQFTRVLEEITLERVECISMAENARRNHPRNKSHELGRLVQLKGAITRQVNRINREARQAKEQTA